MSAGNLAMRRPREVILDTDLGGDIDDLGALAVLLNLARAGFCRPLGLISVQRQLAPIGCIRALTGHLGFSDLPVGRPAGDLPEGEGHARVVADTCSPGWKTQAEAAPTSVTLYRRLLSGAADRSVTLACIAPLSEVLAFLRSGPDETSPFRGDELARRKLAEVVVMGGHERPEDHARPETNFAAWHQGGGVTKDSLALLEGVPIIFCGLELGWRERGFATGRRLAQLPAGDPLRLGYEDFFRRPPRWVKGGSSNEIQPWSIWDQITLLRAVLGENTSGLTDLAGWRCVVNEAGANHWAPDAACAHRRLALAPGWTPARLANEVVEPWMISGAPGGSGRP